MKALVQDEYGGPEVLKIVEVRIPDLGRDDRLVRVHAASLNEWDNGLMRGTPLINRGRRHSPAPVSLDDTPMGYAAMDDLSALRVVYRP